jgi:large subunit ribosomal protein L19
MQKAVLTKVLNKNKRGANHPEFRPGDTIRVHVKIKEGDKERLQAFEGTVIAKHNSGMGETITVRRCGRPPAAYAAPNCIICVG